ncbi:GOLM1 protein, partial [Centropus bengalensis]|nr:GOLM1 protein [Centropus bengalensis]
MKSPPLLVAALLACIIILGCNYWIASSRSVDLQGRVVDLESKVRRAAAERGAVELKKNEFQGELEKQRQQIDQIQSLHSFQMENANRVHQEEKAVLMSNITVNEQLIQNLRDNDCLLFYVFCRSQCINQVKELKEQCEERIDELTKKAGGDVPQVKDNKDFSEDSNKNSQVNIQLPALKQTEFKQADLEQQKHNEDVSKAEPTVKKTDFLQAKERINTLEDSKKQEPIAEEEKLSSELKAPEDSLKDAAGHKEALPESDKELNPSEDEKHVAVQDLLPPAAEQAASEEIEREQLINFDARQDDLPPGKPDQQEQEALNQDKDVDYNVDENEAESETDKQAALAGIE